MEKTKEIEINNFNLSYDGLYRIKFRFEGVKLSLKVDLQPITLFQILLNEKLNNTITDWDFFVEGVTFKESTLLVHAFYENDNLTGFLTSESTEEMAMKYGINLIECEIKRKYEPLKK